MKTELERQRFLDENIIGKILHNDRYGVQYDTLKKLCILFLMEIIITYENIFVKSQVSVKTFHILNKFLERFF